MRYVDENRIPGFMKLLRPMLASQLDDEVGDIHDKMIRNWEMGKDVKGKAWEPLADETIAGKGHSTPLIEERDMIESADYKVDRSELTAVIYIEDEKAAIHEFGAPDQGIVPRPVLQPTADLFNEEAGQIVGHAIDEAYVGASVSGLASHFVSTGSLGALSRLGVRR